MIGSPPSNTLGKYPRPNKFGNFDREDNVGKEWELIVAHGRRDFQGPGFPSRYLSPPTTNPKPKLAKTRLPIPDRPNINAQAGNTLEIKQRLSFTL